MPRIDSAVVELPSSTSNPKILVSPMRVIGKDSAQTAFSQGVTESMITTLSKYIGISVLSNSASLHAENTNMKPTQIRYDWGVDFIISGSTQLMGQNARINLELTDLNSQEVVWSKKKDFTKNDIFRVQDEVSEVILGELLINAVQRNSSNAMKWTEALDSMENYTQLLNFRLEWWKWIPESYLQGQKILDQLVMNMNKGQSLPYALQA